MNPESLSLILIFFGHWVGDFLLQTNAMATQKARSLKWLTLHVLVYTLTLTVFSFFALPMDIAWKYALLNGVLHWVTDLFTSKWAANYSDRPRIFFPIIGFDQFIHTALLIVTRDIVIKL